MKSDKFLQTLIILLQYTLTCIVVSCYITGILCTILFDFSIIKFYFLSTSFIYYLMALVKSPGSLFDVHDSEVKGICTKCNRIRGIKTKHCSICNKCYNKRDHHCMLLGKCIAQDNIKDFIFMQIFLCGFVFLRAYCGPARMLCGFIGMLLILSIIWFSCIFAFEKTSREIIALDKWTFSLKGCKKILYTLKDSPINIFLPFLKLTATVDF